MESNEIMLSTEQKVLIPSKMNAKAFHEEMKRKIFETGEGLFEYLEFLKFVAKVQDTISGTYDPNTGYGDPPDNEFRSYVRSEIEKYPKGKFTSPRGVQFKVFEAGTRYLYKECGDPVYDELIAQLEILKTKVKEREEFLKAIPAEGVDILDNDSGELVKVYPPNKVSTSSYMITLPKI